MPYGLEEAEVEFLRRAQPREAAQYLPAARQTAQVVEAAKDKVKSAVGTYLSQTINIELEGLLEPLGPILEFLATSILQGIGIIAKTVEAAIKAISDPLESGLNALAPSVSGALFGLASLIQGAIDRLTENLATVEDAFTIVSKALEKRGPALMEWVAQAGAGALGVGILGTLENLEQETPEALERVLTDIERVAPLPDWLRDLFGELKAKRRPIFAAVVPILIAAALIPVLVGAVTPVIDRTRQAAYQVAPVALPQPGELAEARLRKALSPGDYEALMRRWGLDPQMAALHLTNRGAILAPRDALLALRRGALTPDAFALELARQGYEGDRVTWAVEAARPVLPDTDLRDGLLRGVIPEGDHDAQLAVLGYTEVERAWRKALYLAIPPPQDLIRMAVREVFTPELRKALDLDAEFPADFARWAQAQGLSEEWARNYWAAHWELPSPTQAFEMLHRGQISEADLGSLLKAQDFSPTWRAKLQVIAYTPLTRVDIRRMHRLEILSEAEVTEAYRAIGYTQENAERLTRFTLALNVEENALAVEPFRASVKGRVVTAFVNAVISGQEASAALQALGYTEAEVNAFLAEAEFVRAFEQAEEVRSILKREYVQGLITWESAEAQLAEAGFGSEEITVIRPAWTEAREHRELSEAERQARDLTKSEVLRAYREAILSADETEAALEALGYDERERAVLRALEDVRQANETANALRDATKAKFLRGMLTRDETSVELTKIGVTAAHRDALIARWEADKIKSGERVPPTTVRDLLKAGLILEDRALTLLSAQGWPPDVTQGIIELWRRGGRAGA